MGLPTIFFLLFPPPNMAFSETKHNEGNLALTWYLVFRTRVNFFRCRSFSTELWPYFVSKYSIKMHSQGPNTMKETLHCPGILGRVSYSLQNKCKFFFRYGHFLPSYGHFLSKNSSKCIFRGQTQWKKPCIVLVF